MVLRGIDSEVKGGFLCWLNGLTAFGILESPSVCQFATIGTVIVRSASPSSGNEKLLNSLQSCLAQGVNESILLRLILI